MKEKPESYIKMMQKLLQKDAVLDRDVFDQEKRDEWDRLSEKDRLTGKNISKKIEENKEVAELLENARVENIKRMKSELASKPAAKLVSKLGARGLKAIPVVGTALGLASAADAARAGDWKTAGWETLSALDPTPLTDIYLAGRDIVESVNDDKRTPGKIIPEKTKEQQQKEIKRKIQEPIKEMEDIRTMGLPVKKTYKPMGKEGEVDSEDVAAPSIPEEDQVKLNVSDEDRRLRKKLGYY